MGQPTAHPTTQSQDRGTYDANHIALVNFAELARQDAAQGVTASDWKGGRTHPHYQDEEPGSLSTTAPTPRADQARVTQAVSPSPLVDFAGLEDVSVGTGGRWIPPEPNAAIGKSKILTSQNNGYRVIDKATGSTLSTVNLLSFWSGFGVDDVGEPRTIYDPYRDRFLVTAVGNLGTSTSARFIGVSATGDPNGNWYLWKNTSAPTCTGGVACWYDQPAIGFNQTWVAIASNMRDLSGTLIEARVEVFPYPTIQAGPSNFDNQLFTVVGGSYMVPASTYSSTESTLYVPEHWSSGAASYRLNTITGTETAAVFTRGALLTHTMVTGWAQPAGEIFPQAPEPGTGLTARVDAAGAWFSSVLFRDGEIWYAQTIGLPAGTYTHTAVQWGRMSTTGVDLEMGRIEDTTATATNGGKWYAYASLALNGARDVMIGFTQFSSAQYPSAGYAYSSHLNDLGRTRDPVIFKAGLGFYYKTYGTRNRWGTLSSTQVDPSDDLTIWTIQEYAATPTGTGVDSGNWGTWLAKAAPPDVAPNPAMSLDTPGNNTQRVQPFVLSGWAIDRGAVASGPGVDAVAVYAYPSDGSASVFLGWATYGSARSDIGQAFGSHFTNSGYSLTIDGLTPGMTYTLVAYAHSSVTATYSQERSAVVTVTSPVPDPFMALDLPTDESTVGSNFSLSGWSIDRGAQTGVGVDYVHAYAYPISGFNGAVTGSPIFMAQINVSNARPDIGAVFGSQFTNSGYSASITSLSPGTYRLYVYGHSLVSGTFNNYSAPIDITVGTSASDPAMYVDTPGNGLVLNRLGAFAIAGWAIDRGASSGTGVGNAGISPIHVWAFPVDAPGSPFFVTAGSSANPRGDIGSAFGSRFTNSGFSLNVPGGFMPAGVYDLYVFMFCDLVGSSAPCQARITRVTVQDPSLSWSTAQSMSMARTGPAHGVIDGKLFVAGGVTTASGTRNGSVEFYDPTTNSWTSRPAMPTPLYLPAFGAIGTKLIVAGGSVPPNTNAVQIYDEFSHAWSPGASMPAAAAGAAGAAAVFNSRLYVAGGFNESEKFNTLVVYDPAIGTYGTWATLANMPTARSMAGAAVINGTLFVVGGAIGAFNNQSLTTVEAYDISAGQWSTKAAMPTPRHGLQVGVLNGRLYAIGGLRHRVENGADAYDLLDVVESYDPVTNTWRAETPIPSLHAFGVAAVLDGALHIVGGQVSNFGTPGTRHDVLSID
jgi:N-acetylneuraminic acid mutarotase